MSLFLLFMRKNPESSLVTNGNFIKFVSSMDEIDEVLVNLYFSIPHYMYCLHTPTTQLQMYNHLIPSKCSNNNVVGHCIISF